MTPSDHSARLLATDITRSVIVQAPAGSGKTTLLVTRYLKALTVVAEPEEVLAITFTVKAAAEMRTRVISALRGASQEAEAVLNHSRGLGWDLLEQPNRLKIQTIDSFAMALARQLPVASGFNPRARLIEAAGPAYQQAADQLLLRLYGSDQGPDPLQREIADFLDRCGNNRDRARALLTTMLGKRDQWLQVVGAVVSTSRERPDEVREVLSRGLMSLNESLRHDFDQILSPRQRQELDAVVDQAAGELSEPITEADDWYRFVGCTFTTASGTLRRRLDKNQGFPAHLPEQKKRALTLLEDFRTLQAGDHLSNLRYMPPASVGDPAQLIDVCICLALAATELEDLFSLSGTSDFTALLLAAQRALGGELQPSDLALTLDHRISHVLVDEFQDTSVSQFRLFEQLLDGWMPGDGRSFFAVGDPMQSIYRFRDADVGLFYAAAEHGIASVSLEPVTLSSNFRSAANLVQWHNSTFARVFGSGLDPVLGSVAFAPAIAARGASNQQAVSCQLFESGADQTSAIASHLASLLGRLENTDATAAVLVRSRGQLNELLPELRRQGILWQANDIDPLVDSPVVRDLFNLGRVLESSTDRLAWFSVFRAPFCGLSLEDLELLASVDNFITELPSLKQQCSADGLQRLERLLNGLDHVAPLRDEVPPRSLIETLWLQLGGPDAYPDPETLNHATRCLQLLDDLGTNHLDVDAWEHAAAALFASDATSSRLRIMTIHKAKGLEFDHVLLPYLDRTTQTDDEDLLLWRALPDGLLLGTPGDSGTYDWLRREDRARARHERERLLYVACTRARQSLSLFASVAGPEAKPARSSLLGLLWPMFAAQLNTGEMSIVPTHVESPPYPKNANEAPRLRLVGGYRWQPAADLLPAADENPDFHADTSAQFAGSVETSLGIILHRELEWLASRQLPPTGETTLYLAGRKDAWRRQAQELAVHPAAAQDLVAEVLRQLSAVLQDPRGRWLLAARESAFAELPLTARVDGSLRNMVVDRTFLEAGQRWLVDYKTGQPGRDQGDADFVAQEAQRHRLQLEAYAAAVKKLFPEPLVLALYFTSLPHLEVIG